VVCLFLLIASWGQTGPAALAPKSARPVTSAIPAIEERVPPLPTSPTLRTPSAVSVASPYHADVPHPMSTTESATVSPQTYDLLSTKTLTRAAIVQLTSPPQTVALTPVTLGHVISMVIRQNLDYQISQINYQIAKDETTAQWGLFDPLLSGSVQESHLVQQGSIFNALTGGSGTGLPGARHGGGPQPEPPLPDATRQGAPPSVQGKPPITASNPELEKLMADLRTVDQTTSGLGGGGFTSDYRSINRMKTRTAYTQVTEQTPWGGSVGLGYSISRNWMIPTFLNINPAYSQALSVWMVQPLPFFQGWGREVTMAAIHLAEKNESTRMWEARQQLQNQIATAASGYWDLVFAIYNAEVQRRSLESARNLLRINEIRLNNGVGTQIDVWEAKAGVAQRENNLIRASQGIAAAQDSLALLTRVNETPNWKVRLIPCDQPRYKDYPVDEQKFVAEARDIRPDIQQARLMRERGEIRRKVARNQMMPRLDGFGSYGWTGLGPTPGRAGDYMGTGDYDNWSIGLDFSYPILNVRARARAREADKLVQGSDLLIQKIGDAAEFQVRSVIRDLQTTRKSIDITNTQVRAEQEKLRGELKRYEVGMATAQDLLDYQDRLASAESSYINAIVQYNKAVVAIELARGTLLEHLTDIGAPEVTIDPLPGPQMKK
jgi:outer membrane protein TolC